MIQRLNAAMQRAVEMEKIEEIVLARRLARLKNHFLRLQANLTQEENLMKRRQQEAKANVTAFRAIDEKVNETVAAMAKVQAQESTILRKEGQLRDEVLAQTQQQQASIK